MSSSQEPRPREAASEYEPMSWPEGLRLALSPRSQPLQVDLTALLEQRQTRREFVRRLTQQEVGEFLWLACRSRSSRPGPYGVPQESRPHPSAGGMHPVHVLLARGTEDWMRYDPVDHALVSLPGTCVAAAIARQDSAALVPLHQGLLLALAVEPGRTEAKYLRGKSLVWRDAGVVLGYMSVVAEALGLSFCPLGVLGQAHVSAAAGGDARIEAAGLAILGAA